MDVNPDRLIADEVYQRNVYDGVAPGYTFGPGNEAHFRLCFAQSHQRLTEALRRTVTYFDRQE